MVYEWSQTEPAAGIPGHYRLDLTGRRDGGFVAVITPAVAPQAIDFTPFTIGTEFALFQALPPTGGRDVWGPAMGAIVISGSISQTREDAFWDRVAALALDAGVDLGPLLAAARDYLDWLTPGIARPCWLVPTDLKEAYVLAFRLDSIVCTKHDDQFEITGLVERMIAWWRTELLGSAHDSSPRAAYIRTASPEHLTTLLPIRARADQLLPA